MSEYTKSKSQNISSLVINLISTFREEIPETIFQAIVNENKTKAGKTRGLIFPEIKQIKISKKFK